MTTVSPQVGDASRPFELPALPYAEDALDPYVSSNTLSFHHGKHHRAYIEATNKAVAGTKLAELTLEELIRAVAQQPDDRAIFNAAAQAWNHAFYWRSLRPKGGGTPSGEVLERIERSFGDFDRFKTSLAAAGRFGSGWAWIVADGRGIAIETTHDADTPIARGRVPLATIDVCGSTPTISITRTGVRHTCGGLNRKTTCAARPGIRPVVRARPSAA